MFIQICQFTCLPNGLSCAPKVFTKILKPGLATLHTMGHISVAHIDNYYLQGQTYDKCVVNVIDTFPLNRFLNPLNKLSPWDFLSTH